ncbi:AraC family transcriptional regulator [Paenibacillus luteus]|uniref:AraC family transcriptional regulator n=1 Tax=Paenibacillus luteus TaxID=2545753 RepID=UPI00114455D2|nr:AraC family transcriptional regulator [Paenibacillus luteus]
MDYFQATQRFVDYIEDHLGEDIDMDEAVSKSHISKFHFYRLFKAIVGITVHEYIKRRKLSKAAEHLRKTNDDVLMTAVKYGFNSQEVFTRNFKKLFHYPPAKFRSMNDDNWRLSRTNKINVDALKLKIKNFSGKVVVHENVEIIKDLRLVGIERVTNDNNSFTVIEAMEHFIQEAERIPNMVNETIYRVCYDMDQSEEIVQYKELIAVEVTNHSNLPLGMTAKYIAYTKVVTYTHEGRLFAGEVEKIINTYQFLYSYRIPYLAYELTNELLLERYGADFKGPYQEDSKMEISFSIR